MRRFAWLSVVALAACSRSSPGPAPGSGGCDYQSFAGQCALLGAPTIATTPDGKSIVSASYALPTNDRPRTWDVRWRIDAARAPALADHVKQHAPAPCSGQFIVRGSCTPWNARVEVPAFPGAEPL